MRNRLLIFVTVLLVAGIGAGWYFFARESRYFGTTALAAVPDDSPCFVRIRDLGNFTGKTLKNKAWQTMSSIPGVGEIMGGLRLIDSLDRREQGKLLAGKELVLVPSDKGNLAIYQISSMSEKQKIGAVIRTYFKNRQIQPSDTLYDGVSIQKYTWKEQQADKELYVTTHMGLLLAGTSFSSLVAPLSRMANSPVDQDIRVGQVFRSTAENADLNFYVNHRTFPAFASRYSGNTVNSAFLQPGYALWTEVDVIQRDNQWLINGFSVTDNTSTSFLDLFMGQKPMAPSLQGRMPSTTSWFEIRCLSDKAAFLVKWQQYLEHRKEADEYRSLKEGLTTVLGFDPLQSLDAAWTGESAVVLTNPNLEDDSDNRFLVLKTRGNQADQLFLSLKKRFTANRTSGIDPETKEAAGYNIWAFPCKRFGFLIGHEGQGDVRTGWITSGDGFILMGANPGSLRRYLELLGKGKFLKDKPGFRQFSSGRSSTSNWYFWCDPGQALAFLSGRLGPDLFRLLTQHTVQLSKLDNLAWQWSSSESKVLNSAGLQFNQDANPEKVPFWSYHLAARMVLQPAFFNFSVAGNDRDLVFQDAENNLVDLDKNGLERWKVHLESPVIGSLKTIEYFRNGEKQLLFNTREAIHLIGQYGREVRRFPVRLKSPATNELSVVDWDGKKEYRYILACRDRRIYALDKNGKALAGWQPKVTEGQVSQPVRHFTSGKKDYLVFNDRNHTYVLDRQGKDRIRPKEAFTRSGNGYFLVPEASGPASFATTDDKGNVRKLLTNGNSQKLNVTGVSSPHDFLAGSLADNGEFNYILVDDKALTVTDATGGTTLTIPHDGLSEATVKLIDLYNERLIELYSAKDNKAICFRKDGSTLNLQLPADYNLVKVAGNDPKGRVLTVIGVSRDGWLSCFQTENK